MTPPFNAVYTSRRGGIYVAVLGSAMLVTLIGMAALAAVQVERLTVSAAADTDKARLYAESAVELGMQWIASDIYWRSNRSSSAWATDKPIGDGTFTLEALDPLDGNLGNRPTDPVVLKSTGRCGLATQIVQVTLNPEGDPLDALAMAVHMPGDLLIQAGATLTVSGAPASTNGVLRNNGAITGAAECLSILGLGAASDGTKLLAPAKAMPDSGIMAMYAALGTVISPPNTVEATVLAPGRNPWNAGATNPDGIYVINLTSDIEFRNCRINGTLVINGNGRRVRISQNVFMHPANPSYPVIITNGDLDIRFSGGQDLSESSVGANFNPAGAPYNSSTDTDTSDTYPGEIQGLIHTLGAVELSGTAQIRGVLIAESTATVLGAAVTVSGTPRIVYDPLLFSNPPMGYTRATRMTAQPGTWKQVVVAP